MTPTSYQVGLLQHTLGLRIDRREPHRNRFVAGPGHDDMPHLEALEASGLMERRRTPAFLAAGDVVFAVTPAGEDVALAALPPEPMRTRYDDWRAADGVESFGEFLCRGRVPQVEQRGGGWRGDPREYRMYRNCEWPAHYVREVQGAWAPTRKAAKTSYKQALAGHRAMLATCAQGRGNG